MRRKAGGADVARHGFSKGTAAPFRPRRRLAASALVAGCALAMALPSTAFASNDPLFAQQWGLAQIGVSSAWNYSTGNGVKVGIVDTGVDLNHEDLAGQVLMSTNCIGANADPSKCSGNGQDDNGHGTHVAGIIAALKDKAKAAAGVAPTAKPTSPRPLTPPGPGPAPAAQAGTMGVAAH